MGKKLIIKGADFSLVALDRDEPTPPIIPINEETLYDLLNLTIGKAMTTQNSSYEQTGILNRTWLINQFLTRASTYPSVDISEYEQYYAILKITPKEGKKAIVAYGNAEVVVPSDWSYIPTSGIYIDLVNSRNLFVITCGNSDDTNLAETDTDLRNFVNLELVQKPSIFNAEWLMSKMNERVRNNASYGIITGVTSMNILNRRYVTSGITNRVSVNPVMSFENYKNLYSSIKLTPKAGKKVGACLGNASEVTPDWAFTSYPNSLTIDITTNCDWIGVAVGNIDDSSLEILDLNEYFTLELS